MTFGLQSELGHANVATEQPDQNSCVLSLMLDMPNNLLKKIWNAFYIETYVGFCRSYSMQHISGHAGLSC